MYLRAQGFFILAVGRPSDQTDSQHRNNVAKKLIQKKR